MFKKGTAAGAASGGALSSIAAGVVSGPVGWIILGCSKDSSYTFDCWKSIVHDDSVEPSKGMLLRNIVTDSRIKDVNIESDCYGNISSLTIENIWNENFNINFFHLMPTMQLVAHATRIITI